MSTQLLSVCILHFTPKRKALSSWVMFYQTINGVYQCCCVFFFFISIFFITFARSVLHIALSECTNYLVIIYYLYCYICGFWLYCCIKFPSRGMQLSACVYGGPPDSPVIGVYVQQVAIYIYKISWKVYFGSSAFCDLNLNF